MGVIVEPHSLPFSIEVDLRGTVLQVKEKLQELLGISSCIQALAFNGEYLQDDQALERYGIVEHSRIQVLFPLLRQPATAFQPPRSALWAHIVVDVGGSSGTAGGDDSSYIRGDAGSLTVMVYVTNNAKIMIQVNAQGMVNSLKEELQKLAQALHRLEAGGYFFIHKNKVMQAEKSFEWHKVENGDTIEVTLDTLS